MPARSMSQLPNTKWLLLGNNGTVSASSMSPQCRMNSTSRDAMSASAVRTVAARECVSLTTAIFMMFRHEQPCQKRTQGSTGPFGATRPRRQLFRGGRYQPAPGERKMVGHAGGVHGQGEPQNNGLVEPTVHRSRKYTHEEHQPGQ